MSNSETQKNKEEEVDDLLLEIKKTLDGDMEGFKDRLHILRDQTREYEYHPQQFMVMADVYLTFFKMDDEIQKKWLSSTVEGKIRMVTHINELEDTQTIIERSMHFADILFYTYSVTGESIYNTAAGRLLYTISGLEGFLTAVGMSLYRMPPQRGERKPFKMPESRAEGMYH